MAGVADAALWVTAGVAASGLIIGWLWVRTESIWLAAIAHGAFNNWGQISFKYMKDVTVPDPVLVAGEAMIGVSLVAILLLAFATPSASRSRQRDVPAAY